MTHQRSIVVRDGTVQTMNREVLEPASGIIFINPSLSEVASALDRLAVEANDQNSRAAYQRAARALFQQPGGRARFDDRYNLSDARALVESGKAKSFHSACILIARKYSGDPRRIRSIAERLRRKHARETNSST